MIETSEEIICAQDIESVETSIEHDIISSVLSLLVNSDLVLDAWMQKTHIGQKLIGVFLGAFDGAVLEEAPPQTGPNTEVFITLRLAL